ncbi:MAG: hypothetical protein ACR2P2_21710, partial [Nakamurella sp.]
MARGGAGLVMSEATSVTAAGWISPDDAGIWTDEQAEAYRRITGFVPGQGAIPAIQLAHAGRKASTFAPWRGHSSVPADQEAGRLSDHPQSRSMTTPHRTSCRSQTSSSLSPPRRRGFLRLGSSGRCFSRKSNSRRWGSPPTSEAP